MILRVAAPTAMLAAALAACGNSAPPEPSATQAPGPSSATRSASCAQLGGISGSVDDHGAQAATGASLSLTADDSFFSPTCFTGVSGGTVTLTVSNHGSALHNVSVDAQGIDMDVSPGQTVTVHVTVKAGSPLTFFCKYHRASGMQGALVPGG